MDVFTLSSGYGLWPCQSLSVHTKNPQPQVEGMFELFKILFFHFLSFNSFHRTAFVIAALRASVMRQLESVALWAQGNCGGCKISIMRRLALEVLFLGTPIGFTPPFPAAGPAFPAKGLATC